MRVALVPPVTQVTGRIWSGALGELVRQDRFLQLGPALLEPSARFLLGTLTPGRDVLRRVLYGARLSLSVGVIAQSLAVAVGVRSNLLAGYYGRWIDALLMRLADITPAFPSRGAKVADGGDLLWVAPWVSFAPGLAIGIAVQGFNLVGNGLREAYDPKLRSER